MNIPSLPRDDKLGEVIVKAFSGIPRPSADHLAIDQDWHPECMEIASDLAGKTWQEVDCELMWNIPPSLLTREAYLYFMPALMLCDCGHSLGPGLGPLKLMLAFGEEMVRPSGYAMERIAAFSRAQLEAAKRYVLYYANGYDTWARHSWDCFWKDLNWEDLKAERR